MAQLAQRIGLRLATAFLSGGLRHPVEGGLRCRREFAAQVLRISPGTDLLNHLPPELWRIKWGA